MTACDKLANASVFSLSWPHKLWGLKAFFEAGGQMGSLWAYVIDRAQAEVSAHSGNCNEHAHCQNCHMHSMRPSTIRLMCV